jgi:hypothetical protein
MTLVIALLPLEFLSSPRTARPKPADSFIVAATAVKIRLGTGFALKGPSLTPSCGRSVVITPSS